MEGFVSEDELRTLLKARVYDAKVSLGTFCEHHAVNSGSAYAWLNGSPTVKNVPTDLLNVLGFKKVTLYRRKDIK